MYYQIVNDKWIPLTRDAAKAIVAAQLNWDGIYDTRGSKDWQYTQQVAEQLSSDNDNHFLAIDNGASCHPRYDIIEVPKIGEAVSQSFNGDSYPAGYIKSISKSLKKITTTTGLSFYRKRLSGAWVNNGTWSMISGHINERNPSF